jgi:ribose transport system substrate-binding protein
MAATVAQQPALIGSLGIDTVKAVLAGKPVQKNVAVSLQLVTK